MPLAFHTRGIREFIDEIRNFKTNLVQFDMDRVKREATKRFAAEMTKMVIQTLKAHPDINAPATDGPYDSGPGPSVRTKAAWVVKPIGNDHTVRPHPDVRQRAIVLNDGLGRIEPDGDGPLRWYVNGVPRFAEFLPADKTHDETQYWQSAFNRLNQSPRVEEIAIEELRDEADRAFEDHVEVIDR